MLPCCSERFVEEKTGSIVGTSQMNAWVYSGINRSDGRVLPVFLLMGYLNCHGIVAIICLPAFYVVLTISLR